MASPVAREVAGLRFAAAGRRAGPVWRRAVAGTVGLPWRQPAFACRVTALSVITVASALQALHVAVLGGIALVACALGAYEVRTVLEPRRPAARLG
ncbi:MAG: hypothetical protein GEV08_04050 [Acidimicrobiia bacterium]|nr:hypothetical protein [Acidimicrobiia bacterium]